MRPGVERAVPRRVPKRRVTAARGGGVPFPPPGRRPSLGETHAAPGPGTSRAMSNVRAVLARRVARPPAAPALPRRPRTRPGRTHARRPGDLRGRGGARARRPAGRREGGRARTANAPPPKRTQNRWGPPNEKNPLGCGWGEYVPCNTTHEGFVDCEKTWEARGEEKDSTYKPKVRVLGQRDGTAARRAIRPSAHKKHARLPQCPAQPGGGHRAAPAGVEADGVEYVAPAHRQLKKGGKPLCCYKTVTCTVQRGVNPPSRGCSGHFT